MLARAQGLCEFCGGPPDGSLGLDVVHLTRSPPDLLRSGAGGLDPSELAGGHRRCHSAYSRGGSGRRSSDCFGRERRRRRGVAFGAPEPQSRRPSPLQFGTSAPRDSALLQGFCQSWRLGAESVRASVDLLAFELPAEPDEAIGWVVENAEDGCPVRGSQSNDHDLVEAARSRTCAASMEGSFPAPINSLWGCGWPARRPETDRARVFKAPSSGFPLIERERVHPIERNEHGGLSVVGGLRRSAVFLRPASRSFRASVSTRLSSTDAREEQCFERTRERIAGVNARSRRVAFVHHRRDCSSRV